MQLIEDEIVTAAILDVNVRDGEVTPVAARLTDIALQLQLPVLASQPDEFIALDRRQAGTGTQELLLPTHLAGVDLGDPVPNGLAR